MTHGADFANPELEATGAKIETDYKPDQADLVEHQKARQRRKERKVKRGLLAIAGWLTIGLMIYLLQIAERTTTNIWNPYEILRIPMSASESQIRKQYKKLSITEHPDKVRPDPAKNITEASINDHWVEVVKAFKALTDEEVRNNWIQFGHPDGKQSFSIGIALPKFIINEGNGKYVLLVYGALLGVVLPLLLGRWWYGTQRVTKENILNESAGNLFREYREDIDENGVVAVTSAGAEYREALSIKKKDHTSSKVEKVVVPALKPADRLFLNELDDEYRRTIFGLLWAYLHRLDLGSADLNEDKFAAAPQAFRLAETFSNMTLAFGNLSPLIASFHAMQSLIQAIPPGASPLLQLPHFSNELVKSVQAAAPDESKNIQSFMSMTEQKRKRLTVGSGLLSEQQYSTAMKVASQLPAVKVERTFFKVTGEKAVTPGSLIQFVVKFRIIPPGTTSIPPVKEADLEEADPREGDLDALHGRNQPKPEQPPLAHAPYFAREHAPRWRVFLSENRSGKIAVPPFVHTAFDKPAFHPDGTPTFEVLTLKMQFQAPPQAGKYAFTMNLICDSYLGFDATQDVLMAVDEASQAAAQIEAEDDISEPEEGEYRRLLVNIWRAFRGFWLKAVARFITTKTLTASQTPSQVR